MTSRSLKFKLMALLVAAFGIMGADVKVRALDLGCPGASECRPITTTIDGTVWQIGNYCEPSDGFRKCFATARDCIHLYCTEELD